MFINGKKPIRCRSEIAPVFAASWLTQGVARDIAEENATSRVGGAAMINGT
jgi:hypothetical protein